jgi:hypothetical protein
MQTENVIESLEKKATAAVDDFFVMARRLAGGEEITPSAAATILERAKRTPDDLRREVERQKHITELRARIEEKDSEIQSAEAEQKKLVELRDAAMTEWKQATEKFNALDSDAAYKTRLLSHHRGERFNLERELKQIDPPPAPAPQPKNLGPSNPLHPMPTIDGVPLPLQSPPNKKEIPQLDVCSYSFQFTDLTKRIGG